MNELRPYQIDMISRIESAWQNKRALCAVLPTGGGKTRIINEIVSKNIDNGPIFVIAHRRNLVKQLSKSLTVSHGLIMSGSPTQAYRVQVCSIASLIKRVDIMVKPKMIIIDEMHHATNMSYQQIIQKCPDAKLLGMTATPIRGDGLSLKNVVEELIIGPSVTDLIMDGFLSSYDYYAPGDVDMSDVKIVLGEYDRKEAKEKVDRRVITGSAIEHYQKYADHKPAIAACISIEHCEHVAQQFRDAGYRAAAVHSEMSQIDIDRGIEGLADGSVEILCNCDLISEGIDIPNAQVLIGLRPTASIVIYLQHIGRVMRKHGTKSRAIIIDHVRNWEFHGLPDDDRKWELKDKVKNKGDGSIYKQCPNCLRPISKFLMECPFCDYIFPVEDDEEDEDKEKPRSIMEIDGELKKIVKINQNVILAIARHCPTLKDARLTANMYGLDEKIADHIWTKVLLK